MAKEHHRLFYNGKIWQSGAADKSWMVIDTVGGVIVDMGVADPPLQDFPTDRQQDCEDRRVLPGLHDAHIHVSSLGDRIHSVDLCEVQTIDELKGKLNKFAEANPALRCIRGSGWEQDVLGRYPDRADLDSVVSEVPVRLHRICSHVAVVNSKTLQLAGINKDTVAPSGGSIDKYPAGHPQEGEPSGILRENALDLIYQLFTRTEEENSRNIQDGLQKCLQYGCTSVHSNEPSIWNEYCQLADQGKLPIRVFMACYYNQRDSPGFPAAGVKHGDFLSCDRIKLFVDGALGGYTAAISEPYINTDQKGMLLHTQEELDSLVKEADASGYRLEIHVIGDVAAEAALASIEKAKISKDKRPILTHCQILRKDLIEKMVELGVVANIQPQFLTKDTTWLAQRIPRKLMRFAYTWKTLLIKGIPCAGGSDAPVEEPNPFWGMYDAIYRPIGKRYPTPANIDQMMRSDQSFSIQQAIDLYTKGGAYATMAEDRLGQLTPGYQADFVIVHSDTDICKNKPELLEAEPQEVWVMGQLKYKREQKQTD